MSDTKTVSAAIAEQPGDHLAIPARRVVLGPWRGLIAPQSAAADFAKAPPVEILISLLFAGVVLAFATTIITVSDMTYEVRDHPVKGSSPPRIEYTWHERSWADAWSKFGQNVSVSYLGAAAGAAIWILIAVVGGALVHVQRVHQTASLWRSYRISIRGAAAGAGAITLLSVLGVAASSLESRLSWREIIAVGNENWRPAWYISILGHETAMLFAVGVFWIGFFVRRVRPMMRVDELPLRCEGCGYDLRHQSERGCCSECGLDLSQSLEQPIARPGSRWENRPSPWSWLVTTVNVLTRPRRFYHRLRVRTPDNLSAVFSAAHYVMFSAATLPLAYLAATTGYYQPYSFIGGYFIGTRSAFDAAFFAVIDLTFVCWILHRGIGLFGTILGGARRLIPNGRWAAKVQDYEVAVIWFFPGLCMVSLVVVGRVLPLFPAALSTSRSTAWFLVPPPFTGPGFLPPAGIGSFVLSRAVTLTAGALVLIGLLRYWRAFRMIRWSNF